MIKYVIKRIFSSLFIFFSAVFIVFMIFITAANSAWEAWLASHSDWIVMGGWRNPLFIDFLNYITGVFMGDFGWSFTGSRYLAVSDELMLRLPYTLRLGATALLGSILMAFPIGILSAVKKNTWIERLITSLSMLGSAMPNFMLGILLILFFSVHLGWLPSFGADSWYSVILPAAALGTTIFASLARATHFAMLEVLEQNYIKTARAKGLSYHKVICKHAVRNVLIPVLRTLGFHIGTLFTGIIIIEYVFSWPGIGRFMVQNIQVSHAQSIHIRLDFAMVLGILVVFIICSIALNFLIDIICAVSETRTRKHR